MFYNKKLIWRGWTKFTKPVDIENYLYVLKSPEGVLHKFSNIELFSMESSVPVFAIYALINFKRRDYYGWSIPEIDLQLVPKWSGGEIAVKKIDKNTGKVLEIFQSYTDAAKSLIDEGSKASKANLVSRIAQCVRGERLSTCGYQWEKSKNLKI